MSSPHPTIYVIGSDGARNGRLAQMSQRGVYTKVWGLKRD